MKKYITVAALLAAGTAFANADVVAVFNCGGSDATREGWMDQSPTWTLAQMANEYGSISVSTGEDGISLRLTGDGLGSTGAGGSFTVGEAGDSGPYAIPANLKNLSQGVFNAETYNTLWGGAVNMWNKGSATFTLSGLTANTEYTIYLFSARANANTGANQQNGSVTWAAADGSPVATWTTYTWSDSSLKTANSFSTVYMDGSMDGQNAAIVKLEFTTGTDETSFAFSSGTNAQFTLNGMVIDAVAIPEPSAFGLLAGLGALALVASRRRRK